MMAFPSRTRRVLDDIEPIPKTGGPPMEVLAGPSDRDRPGAAAYPAQRQRRAFTADMMRG